MEKREKRRGFLIAVVIIIVVNILFCFPRELPCSVPTPRLRCAMQVLTSYIFILSATLILAELWIMFTTIPACSGIWKRYWKNTKRKITRNWTTKNGKIDWNVALVEQWTAEFHSNCHVFKSGFHCDKSMLRSINGKQVNIHEWRIYYLVPRMQGIMAGVVYEYSVYNVYRDVMSWKRGWNRSWNCGNFWRAARWAWLVAVGCAATGTTAV